MQSYYQIRINFKGGIVSPSELKNIMLVAKDCQVQEVRIGLRQQMIFHLPHTFGKKFGLILNSMGVKYQVDENDYPNIISSYVAEEVFQSGNWLTEGIYKDILDGFEYDPKLKINLSDANQSFTPYFSGHLNFIASPTPNFWYLYIRIPKTNKVFCFDKLIFSNEIPAISTYLEEIILVDDNNREQDIEYIFSKIPSIISLPIESELVLPKFTLPYYEGFNRYGNKTWLGIYRRNETFAVDFLIEVCNLCQETKIGEICFTPWKSLIIKGIQQKFRQDWSNILTKFNINVRHAANELNWQVEDDSDDALQLKLDLVKAFDKQDLRTFGLCFGIKTRPKTEVYASIMIKRRRFMFLNFIPTFNIYDISYTEDFNPNGRTKKFFAEGVIRFNLSEQLRRSVLLYNKMTAEDMIREAGMKDDHREVEIVENTSKKVHQCSDCYTIYDSEFGDELNGISAGIAFEKLPKDYCCPTCEAPKKKFKIIEVKVKELI